LSYVLYFSSHDMSSLVNFNRIQVEQRTELTLHLHDAIQSGIADQSADKATKSLLRYWSSCSPWCPSASCPSLIKWQSSFPNIEDLIRYFLILLFIILLTLLFDLVNFLVNTPICNSWFDTPSKLTTCKSGISGLRWGFRTCHFETKFFWT